MSSSTNESFTISFPIWMPVIYPSSCLITGDRTFNTTNKKSAKSEQHPFLVPTLEVLYCVHAVYNVSSGFVIYSLYYIEICFLHLPLAEFLP